MLMKFIDISSLLVFKVYFNWKIVDEQVNFDAQFH